jgi:Cof subfamily protein (haloacid dehalogenase superfamily)
MRLVASDLDGTIVGHDGAISDRTVRAFNRCREAGVEIVFVTGRPPRWLDPLREQMRHTGTVICSNGAVMYDLGAEKVLELHALDPRDVIEARDVIRDLYPGAVFAAETVEGFMIEPGFAEAGSKELLAGAVPAPFEESLPGKQPVKFLARERNISPDEFLDTVRPAVEHLVATTHSAPRTALLEMCSTGINKSVTLARYAEELGIARDDVVAFGDMPNDVQMLGWAGHGYAMASGHPDALSAANLTAPAFDDDGVARILEQRLAALDTVA